MTKSATSSNKTKMLTAGTLTLVTSIAAILCALMAFVLVKPFEAGNTEDLTKETTTEAEWDIRGHLCTMTPYKYAKTGSSEAYTAPAGCKLVSLDLMARHGSRYPTARTVGVIKSLEKFTETHNTSLKMPWMRNWISPFTMEDEGQLSQMGIQEHINLGKHFLQKFPSILQGCNTTNIRFKATFVNKLFSIY